MRPHRVQRRLREAPLQQRECRVPGRQRLPSCPTCRGSRGTEPRIKKRRWSYRARWPSSGPSLRGPKPSSLRWVSNPSGLRALTKRLIETRRQEPQRYSRERSQLQKQTRNGHFQNPLLSLQIRLGPPIFRRAATVWGRREKKQKGERRQRGVSTGDTSQTPSWPGWTNDPRPGQKVLARNIRPAPALHS